jgi:hypothetical protein
VARFLLLSPPMRYFLLGVILVLVTATPVQAASSLRDAVEDTWGNRINGDRLHDIAVQRVLEISRCDSCMTHNLQRDGTAEVLGWNAGYPYPIRQMVRAWRDSYLHNAILSDKSLDRIGCAHRKIGGKHFFACVLR